MSNTNTTLLYYNAMMQHRRRKWLTIGIITLSIGLVFGLGFPLLMLTESQQGKVSLHEPVSVPLAIQQSPARVILVFFGYVGCRTICVPSLGESAQIMETLSAKERESVAFYFIDISQNKVDSESFAHYFHASFQGIQPPLEETLHFMKQLRAYRSDPLLPDGDIYHSGYLYLIKHETSTNAFVLKTVYYTRPFETKIIVEDIQKELL